MKRWHLFELHDCHWFPSGARDCVTLYLQFLMECFRPYAGAGRLLSTALKESNCTRIVDLCSGAGGPLPLLARSFPGDAHQISVLLSDKFPNKTALARYNRAESTVQYSTQPLDCLSTTDIPRGFRTMFTAFHHFQPLEARTVLCNSTTAGCGIGIFEVTERSILACLRVLFITLLMPFVVPFIRGSHFRHLFWTYVIPLAPISVFIDGLVSNMRTYTPAELQTLVAELNSGETPSGAFAWQSGKQQSTFGTNITYLIGVPQLQ